MKPIIDISKWQAPSAINYDTLAGNISGAILRANYGRAKDTQLDTHYAELTARGISLGCYVFITQYQTVSSQVDALQSAIAGKVFKLGLWLDVEIEGGADKLTATQVNAFVAELDRRGIAWEGIYTSKHMWSQIFGNSNPYSHKRLWVAHYTTALTPLLPYGWNKHWLWQYSSTGRVGGYSGNLDMNRFGGSESEWAAWVGAEPQPVPTAGMYMGAVYWQRDPRWANYKLGTKSTIGAHGCLLCCNAVVACAAGHMTNPYDLNKWMTEHEGYFDGNLWLWDKLTGLYPDMRFEGFTWYPNDETIKAKLRAGILPILLVDLDESTPLLDMHWVVPLGIDAENYLLIYDPWTNDIVRLRDRYKNQIIRFASYKISAR